MNAESAFFHDALPAHAVTQIMLFLINLIFGYHRVTPVKPAPPIRAGRHAVPAANAPIVVHYNNAVRLLPGGLGGAGLDAWGILAMETLHPHVELVLHRDFMMVFAIAGGWVKFAGFHFKEAAVLGL